MINFKYLQSNNPYTRTHWSEATILMLEKSRYHVATGSYRVDTQKPTILEAYLGTCVGVALYDPVAGVGGLIHLLLPEPATQNDTFQPEKYASTGFPLFVQAMYDAGARAENIKACIAGGALVGPVNDTDLEMDIGGRTAERVMQLISAENIQVEKLETGGFFTCRLELDLDTGKFYIQPAGFDKLSADDDVKIPLPGEIGQSIKDIQPVPQIALKLMRIINADRYEIKNVTEEIRKDQVISARTLQLCNSVMFARRKKIESLDHALVMLGQHLLLKFVISASLNNFFKQIGLGYSLCKGGLYHHAIGTAVIAASRPYRPACCMISARWHWINSFILDFPFFTGNSIREKKISPNWKNSCSEPIIPKWALSLRITGPFRNPWLKLSGIIISLKTQPNTLRWFILFTWPIC